MKNNHTIKDKAIEVTNESYTSDLIYIDQILGILSHRIPILLCGTFASTIILTLFSSIFSLRSETIHASVSVNTRLGPVLCTVNNNNIPINSSGCRGTDYDSTMLVLQGIKEDIAFPGCVNSIIRKSWGSKQLAESILDFQIKCDSSMVSRPLILNHAKIVVEQIKEKSNISATIGTQVFSGSSLSQWLTINKPHSLDKSKFSFKHSLLRNIFYGILLSFAFALLFRRQSILVYSKTMLLDLLPYPILLRLTEDSESWPSSPLMTSISQLPYLLDKGLDWRIMSIAKHNKDVNKICDLLNSVNRTNLSFNIEKPLLSSVLYPSNDERPLGLLLVVKTNFNSPRALKDVQLTIQRLSYVHQVYLILVGEPMIPELKGLLH